MHMAYRMGYALLELALAMHAHDTDVSMLQRTSVGMRRRPRVSLQTLALTLSVGRAGSLCAWVGLRSRALRLQIIVGAILR